MLVYHNLTVQTVRQSKKLRFCSLEIIFLGSSQCLTFKGGPLKLLVATTGLIPSNTPGIPEIVKKFR